ncbi:hydrogen peroxide-inducible genes activator [Ruegeria sp. SCSIO 43209]|uniref:hydrogen peroxide-inducible genes activator n=1 Tax=Ruegeria sp. SCSIO 43209 TaxID=2793010 RepID=UPI002107EF68|nr:hydrogen peroxide-inducible genes activator [Ruegeria sp. SCSIO 43209]
MIDIQLTLKQLSYFRTLADTGHYRKAAERIGISQPSLSLQIANLESVLCLNLVERGRAGAMLTPEGREILEQTRSILSDVMALQETHNRMKSELSGSFRLGSSPTLGPYLLPRVFLHLHQNHPDLRLIVRDGPPSELLQELLSGMHDVILTQLPVKSADVFVQRLLREPLHLAVALSHPLAKKEYVEDEDLKGENVLVLSRRFTLHSQIENLTKEVGANLLYDYEGTSLDAIRQMTAMNIGISFLPSLYVASEVPKFGGDVALVPYRPGRLNRSIGLVWRASSGHHRAFSFISDAIRSVAKTDYSGLVSVEK